MKIVGCVSHTIYENDPFSIRTFVSKESVVLPNGKLSVSFHIKGEYLPASYIDVEIEGEFDTKPFVNKNGRKTFTFDVSSVSEIKIPKQDSIIKYLSSLKGVGNRLAHRIYEKFGDRTFDVMDNDIRRLLEIKGVGEQKFAMIENDYLSRGYARELFIYLDQFRVPKSKIKRILGEYKGNALNAVEGARTVPFSLYLKGLLSFEAAEKIGHKEGLDSLSDGRVQGCIVESLRRSETEGNTFLTYSQLLKKATSLLGADPRNERAARKIFKLISSQIKPLVSAQYIVAKNLGENNQVIYRRMTYEAEYYAAKNIRRLVSASEHHDYTNDILTAEKKLGITLSDEQKAAVSMAMNSSLSVVTGGPGTGKTSFQKVLLEVFRMHSNGKIALAAPTGKAATRMKESSGLEAKTIHQLLGLVVSDDDNVRQRPEPLDAGLLIIDEMSMVDIFVADKLFSAIKPGTRVVCVGDAFQLPSVGCGEVLQDMINSGYVPVTKFTKVFRQADGSLIASNASAINHGDTNLEYGPAFIFFDVEENANKNLEGESLSQQIARYARAYYSKALKTYGQDEVILLTPYRRTTATGVNELNPELKKISNPAPEKVEDIHTEKIDGMDIYKGDKVMFTKNVYINDVLLSNGDTGYVTNIRKVDNIQTVTVDLDGRKVDLMGEDLKSLVLAYATTVHKSQGSEYKCCIIVVDPKHSILLRRNLVYTAVTRAKEKVIIVGSKKELKNSILTVDTGTRQTNLKKMICPA